MTTETINGVELYFETHGEGTPLVLVAGLASDSQSWEPALAEMAANCRVIAPDNRGVGRTKPQDVETGISTMADDCIALARRLGLRSVNLLGHSMGGFVALDCAVRYPECVDKLILVATSAANSRRNNALFSDWASCLESGMDPVLWVRNLLYWIFSARFFQDEAAVNEAVRLAIDYPYPQSASAFRNQVRAIAAFDRSGNLAEVAARTLVIGGKEDLLFPPERCADLAGAIPGAVFSVIDEAAHAVHVEQPRAFTECVLDFLLR